ncbi:A24 family peptidase [Halalkalicoccus jeotgali]|uniref:Peptidase A24A prepilin type IV n=1 Tax=Halalkalicoccus jeotgali (strain DSM 18796 / CECT 7217 / JCM 14584 / KCTC 4019 / B3) TaxID=795797 RepID=D8J3U8_HALJB|nr:peptidase A24A prepilin type IV [Halalkalicoccus jeotgali B3]ELY33086.1 peptidase A24A prepilin type IV [Halalkalicoccus jeotgali B3]
MLCVPVLAWAAHRDVRTRRVPARTWTPLFALAAVLFVWDGIASYFAGGLTWAYFLVGAAISLLLVIPAAYGFWRFGAFGGADAKALIVLALLFPTYPTYEIGPYLVPVVATPTGAFALTILANTVLVGACYPLVLAVRNALSGRLTALMVVGRPVHWSDAERTHGRVLEDGEGFTRSGLDLDALRMYLRWRGTTLSALREDPARFRDPGSLPAEPAPAGDGAIADGGEQTDGLRSPSDLRPDGGERTNPSRRNEDEWGAEAFLADVGSAYGTTAEGLREGLDVLTTRETVWISPGIPFLVPILVGLLVALVYGDVLTGALRIVGVV